MQNRSASVVIVAGNKLIGSSYTTPELEFNGTDEVDESRAGAAGKSVPARLQAPGLSQPLMVQVSERYEFYYLFCHSRHILYHAGLFLALFGTFGENFCMHEGHACMA